MDMEDADGATVVLDQGGAVVAVERGLRRRHDGWTRERQEAFCDALSRSGSVTFACRAVGMSTTNAYRTRSRLAAFAARWDAALRAIAPALEAAAYTRAVDGWEEPVFQGGRQVGTRRRYSDNLLRLLLLRGPAPQESLRPTSEDVDASLMRKLDAIERRIDSERRSQSGAAGDATLVPGSTGCRDWQADIE